MRSWWRQDRGSVSSEVVLITPILVLLLVFVAVVVHRGVTARLRLNDVAHQAARAASIERPPARAAAQASAVATAALASAGPSCRSTAVETNTAKFRPGGAVSVIVSCEVDLGDALLLAVPSRKWLSAKATEPVDVYRGATGVGGGGA